MYVRAAHDRQDVDLVGAHAFERQIKSRVGVDVRKSQRIHEIADFLIRAFGQFLLQLRKIDDANYTAPIRHQPGS